MTAAADSEHADRRAAAPSDLRPHIDVLAATKTAIPALVFPVISDAATTHQESNAIKNKNIRMYHPWSYLTVGASMSWSRKNTSHHYLMPRLKIKRF